MTNTNITISLPLTESTKQAAYQIAVEARRLDAAFSHATEDAPIRDEIRALFSMSQQIAEAIQAAQDEQAAEAAKLAKLKERPLGRVQKGVLESLNRRGSYPGGWVWDTHSNTLRVLDGLVKRGLVSVSERAAFGRSGTFTSYRITDEGREALGVKS